MGVNNNLYLGIGNVSWEPNLGAYYQDLKEAIYHFDNITFDSLPNQLENILNNFDDIRIKSAVNAPIRMDFASWNVLIKDWIRLHTNLYHGSK